MKSRLLAEKFRDSIRDIRARESILDKGILDDTGKLKDSVVIIGIAKRATEVGDLLKSGATVAQLSPPDQTELESMINKAVVAALQQKRQSPSYQGHGGNTPSKFWRCHYCNTTIPGGGRPVQIGVNIIPPGPQDGKNLGRAKFNKQRGNNPLSRIFAQTCIAEGGGCGTSPTPPVPTKESGKKPCQQTDDGQTSSG